MDNVWVEIKRVKITSSILKQVLGASYDEMIAENVIGWVIEKGIKKILIYDKLTKKLKFAYYPTSIEIEKDYKQIDNVGTRELQHVITYGTTRGTIYFKDAVFHDLENVTKKYERLKEFHIAANTHGQIYF